MARKLGLTLDDSLAMFRLRQKGMPVPEIARKYGISVHWTVRLHLRKAEQHLCRGTEQNHRHHVYKLFEQYFPEIPRDRYAHYFRLSREVPRSRYENQEPKEVDPGEAGV